MHCSHFTRSRHLAARRVNWDGDRIVVPPVVETFRPIPGQDRPRRCSVDVRSFLSGASNAVLKSIYAREFRAFVRNEWGADFDFGRFEKPNPGSFDLRAVLLADFVGKAITYTTRKGEFFQLPEETWARRAGDCEDRAIFLGALLVAGGISPYNVRVALGTVHYSTGRSRASADHAWVVYKDEVGSWLLLEPRAKLGKASKRPRKKQEPDTLTYDPSFLFNGDHLWFVGDRPDRETPSSYGVRRRWNGLDPTFVGDVHASLLGAAFEREPLKDHDWLRKLLEAKFTIVAEQTIDAPDWHFRRYDPRDHFDNGLVEESWQRVDDRLASFYRRAVHDPQGVQDLCYALHAIADFYAHTTYAHFALRANLPATPYSPAVAPVSDYDYAADAEFEAALPKLAPNAHWFDGKPEDAIALWKGRIISGRYSQPGDRESFVEGITRTLPESFVKDPKRRAYLGSLPHHDAIAVDDASRSKKHRLYATKESYAAQFAWRLEAATLHIVAAVAKHREIVG